MKVPDDVICGFCKKIFCCSECRHKHELKTHAIAATVIGSGTSKTTEYLFCAICEEKPLVLKSVMNPTILEHIKKSHLPLQCEKCFKLYTKIEDLREFSKCFQTQNTCASPKYTSQNKLKTNSNENMVQITTATQTSPITLQGNGDSHYITPNSMINLRWKSKSKLIHEGFVSDSVSSIKNFSSINNSSSIQKSTGICKGKLVRSTSTPLAAELFFSKPNDQGFNASTSGQVSSIYNSGSESYGSNPLSKNQPGTPAKQTLDMNRYNKVGGRAKMSAVTPLRQIMSKSIQKAFAEHGFSKAVRGADGGYFGKKIFENADNSLVEHPISHTANAITSPLDLRLSPALRRSYSEPIRNSNTDMTDSCDLPQAQMKRNVLLAAKKTTTESIVITSSSIQHMASLELPREDDSTNSTSMTQPNTISISSKSTEAHSVRRQNSRASLYQTCSSVKIIHTSTELSALKLQESSSYPEEQSAEKQPLLTGCLQNFDILSNDYADHTPTTRVKGSVIKEKLIKFDTPKVEGDSVKENLKENSVDDVFFTPDATPLCKPRLRKISSKEDKDSDVCERQLWQKQIHGRRTYLQDSSQTLSFNRIQDITDDDDCDEVFYTETDACKKPDDKQIAASGRSLWSLMSSAIMRIPSFNGGQTTKILERSQSMGLEACSKFILKRCASIAGSIVRSKPLVPEEQLKSFKRKRTYTMDSQNTTYSSTYGCEPVSSKRFRIQARKPIDRMRLNS